jgi:hypothetical protein
VIDSTHVPNSFLIPWSEYGTILYTALKLLCAGPAMTACGPGNVPILAASVARFVPPLVFEVP